jgi:hypothetical protein
VTRSIVRSSSCSTPNCAAAARSTGWRRIFRWPLFAALAVVHLTLLPLVLADGNDQLIAMLGGVIYLALAALDWRRQHSATPA